MLYSDRNILITCHICANNSIFSGRFRFVENTNAPLVQEKTTVTVYFTVIRTHTLNSPENDRQLSIILTNVIPK